MWKRSPTGTTQGSRTAAVSGPEAISVSRGRALALVARPWYDAFDWGWFDPEWWHARARPVDDGGRGSAWFIEARPPMVLRHYQRGGMVARLSRRTYLYIGMNRTRSFAEFRMLAQLQSLGLPVPAPVAAAIRRDGPLTYRAAILVERLEGTRSLASLAGMLGEDRWRAVGRTIRAFHNAGVCHADLNCFNILLSDDRIYLIDFDKAFLRKGGARWRRDNLERLYRSLAKGQWPEAGLTLDQAWARLLEGYQAPDAGSGHHAWS